MQSTRDFQFHTHENLRHKAACRFELLCHLQPPMPQSLIELTKAKKSAALEAEMSKVLQQQNVHRCRQSWEPLLH